MDGKTIMHAEPVRIDLRELFLDGDLTVPEGAGAVVVFAHGSGSSRFSPRNRAVAAALNDGGLATLLMDLLTAQEQRIDDVTAHLRFNIDLLADRLIGALEWLPTQPRTRGLGVGLFGASTGAAAALVAAALRPEAVGAVVSRGGRPDLAGDLLPRVRSPVLLIVGGVTAAIGLALLFAPRAEASARRHPLPGQEHVVPLPARDLHRGQHRPDGAPESRAAMVQAIGSRDAGH